MAQPLVSVIVPHLDDHDRLRRCLESLSAQTWPADKTEIIVVDNGSHLPADIVVRDFPNVRLVVEPERGCGIARNRGIAQSRGEILCFTDSDVIAGPGWIECMVAGLRHADVVGGRVEVFAASADEPSAAELYERVFAFQNETYIRRKRFSVGCSIATTREACSKIGPFLGPSLPEDLEWGQRASKLGFRLAYVENAVVHHPARPDDDALRKKTGRTLLHQVNLWRYRLGPWFWLRWAIVVAGQCTPPVFKLATVMISPRLSGSRHRLQAAKVVLWLRVFRVIRLVRLVIPSADHSGLGLPPFPYQVAPALSDDPSRQER
jgi:GT2 family glycosyltransferase